MILVVYVVGWVGSRVVLHEDLERAREESVV